MSAPGAMHQGQERATPPGLQAREQYEALQAARKNGRRQMRSAGNMRRGQASRALMHRASAGAGLRHLCAILGSPRRICNIW